MFFLAYIGAFSFGWSHLESLYLAGILSISSTAISLHLMRDMKLVKTKEFNIVITILIIEDLAAVLLLVILGNTSAGADLDVSGVGMLILQSLTFFVIALGLGIKLIPKLLEKIHGLHIPEGPFITALLMLHTLVVSLHLTTTLESHSMTLLLLKMLLFGLENVHCTPQQHPQSHFFAARRTVALLE